MGFFKVKVCHFFFKNGIVNFLSLLLKDLKITKVKGQLRIMFFSEPPSWPRYAVKHHLVSVRKTVRTIASCLDKLADMATLCPWQNLWMSLNWWSGTGVRKEVEKARAQKRGKTLEFPFLMLDIDTTLSHERTPLSIWNFLDIDTLDF